MIGENLKKKRTELGLTLVQFAEMINSKGIMSVRPEQLGEWENNTHTPHAQTLQKLVESLDCTIEELNKNSNKKEMLIFFQNEGYELGIMLCKNSELVQKPIYELTQAFHEKDTEALLSITLQLYNAVTRAIPQEMTDICLDMISNDGLKGANNKETELYLDYMFAFITGLNNGVVKKIKMKKSVKETE